MSYRYETHCHTRESSRCGRASAEESVRFYLDQGYDGIVMTDHFLSGNTTAPALLGWRKRVDIFCRGWEAACEAGEKLGLKVFFGWEHADKGTDFLTYGLDKAWLLDNENLDKLALTDYLNYVRAAGALVVHAHPFREDFYIPAIQLVPRLVDAVEIANANRKDFENRLAADYAASYGLPAFAGSDNHAAAAQKRLCGIETDTPLESIADFCAALRSGSYRLFDRPAEVRG